MFERKLERWPVPVKRFNFTARQQIMRSDVGIVLQNSESGPGGFNASFDLGAYDFPPDARVFVEAYRQTILMRFNFGTVSAPTSPTDMSLVDFPSTDEILFRIRVTAASERPGVLLGEVDRIRPRTQDE